MYIYMYWACTNEYKKQNNGRLCSITSFHTDLKGLFYSAYSFFPGLNYVHTFFIPFVENDPNRVGMCYAMQYKFCTLQGKKMYGMLLSYENTSGGNEGDAVAADDDDGERSAINVIQIMGWDPRNNHSTTSWESSGDEHGILQIHSSTFWLKHELYGKNQDM